LTKSEILFYYESRQNPNGDPDSENQPRLQHDETIMVTDVRIKRTIRDFAKEKFGYALFVDYDEKGNPITADGKAKEIASAVKDESGDYIQILLEHTFDVPLFGALVTLRKSKDSDEETGSQKLTGPVQFAISRSVNKVNLLQPTITSRFVGKVQENKDKQHSTIGKFYAVEYALIKTSGVINPANLGPYIDNNIIKENFDRYCNELPSILYHGTNQLVTRSKYPQKSIFYLQVDYKDTLYNDLHCLVDENANLKKQATLTPTELGDKPFDFTKLVSTLNQRKNQIEKIRIMFDVSISDDVSEMLLSKLDGIKVDSL